MAKVKMYSNGKRSHVKRSALCLTGVLLSTAVLCAGCTYIQEKYFATTVYETESTTSATGIQVSVDPDAVVSPESIGEAVITTTTETTLKTTEGSYYRQPTEVPSELTLESFANVTDKNTIEDLEKELGPWIRHEAYFYVWSLSDGSEVWVAVGGSDMKNVVEAGVQPTPDPNEPPETKRPIETVIHVNGFDQEVMYLSSEDNLFTTHDLFAYEVSFLVEREFGPELERGWYIMQRGDENYIIVSAGRREARDCRVWLHRVRVEEFDAGSELFFLVMGSEYFDEERPELGPYPYPCCGIKIDTLPPDIIVKETGGKQMQFKGYLVLDEEE